MHEKDAVRELFNSLIDDETEKKIMNLIVDGKSSDEIIDYLLEIKRDGGK